MADLKTPKGRTMAKIAGDPDTLDGEVTRMKNVAATIEKLTGMLSDIHNKKNSQSMKIDKIRDTAGESSEALEKAKSLYNGTGWALGEYNKQLHTSTKNGNAAYNSAVDLLPHLNAAETAHNTAVSNQKKAENDPTPTTPEETAAAKTKSDNLGTAVTNTNSTLTAKQEEMDGYKRAWDTAYDDLNTAAETARGHIKKVINDSPAKDSWWDNLAGFLQALSSILGWIALVCVIVALFVSGRGILLAIALVATAIKLVADSALAAGNKGKWLDVGLDVIALIPFGKLLGPGLKLGERLPAAGKDIIETVSHLKPGNWGKGPQLLDDAITAATRTAKGTEYVYPKTAQAAQAAADNAAAAKPQLLWDALKNGGSYEAGRANAILDQLPGQNSTARAAIEAARSTPTGTAGALATGGQGLAGVGGQYNGSVVRGDDWVTNEVTHVGHEVFNSPSDADLKARVQAAPMLVPAGQLEEPDWDAK
jgi:hypothetical protein